MTTRCISYCSYYPLVCPGLLGKVLVVGSVHAIFLPMYNSYIITYSHAGPTPNGKICNWKLEGAQPPASALLVHVVPARQMNFLCQS